MQKNTRSFAGILLAIAVMFAALPVNVLAEVKPWDAYAQYIPNKAPAVKRQLRGTWISTVANLDWPTAQTMKIASDAERIRKSKEELVAILDRAVEMNMNAVFFQVSPGGDALYKSNIVPWSRYLTGTFGKDPGFDPLAFAIEEAHKRNLEIHAWFNPYRVSMDTKEATIASLDIEKSVYKEHPEWIKTSANRLVVDPGIPEARAWVIDRVMEVVDNYDVDGIHFDDYFYNENYEGEMKDRDTFNKYNKGQFSNIGDWRRNNTYLLVKELSNRIRTAKPWVKFGISPAGVWGNKKDGLPDGSNTSSGYTNYSRSFADTKKWVEEELVDYIAPQIYFSFANTAAPYGEVATWWSNVCRGKKVQLYIGQALYKVNDDSDPYFQGENAVQEFLRQLKFNGAKPEIMGSILFRAQDLSSQGKQQVISAIRSDLWSIKALVPVMPWKGGKAPAAPVQGKLDNLSTGLKLSWTDNDPGTAYYAIYRFNKSEKMDITSDASTAKLVGTVRKNGGGRQEYTDTQAQNAEDVYYVVTALDRLHNESGGLVVSTEQSKYFPDVGREYSWAVKAIDGLCEKGIVKGDDQGRFNPGQNTKRGDFILMAVRALNLKADFKDNFRDVAKGSYYYDAIGTAKTLGIAKGDGGSFNPNGNITREDMMVVAVRAIEASGIKLEKAGEEYLKGYNDASRISGYAREAVASLTKAGLVQGSGGGVNPKSMATRAEIAVMLDRLLDSIFAYG
ncbi:MAG: family 10 glycosylhydrolase [Clostridiales bacterium]|jgi:uncharacterized lipoprotein YddW (UPF0748 family)|nr:family 10 glycosylhydrolase [Eubacteriales bacterium]MDH7567167.1 family 10 glycosylhydrolase [Clostridiales bacterium]